MPEPLLVAILLIPVGACVGLIGSLIGVGGGFFVVPFLLTVPVASGAPFQPCEATAASLAVILLNAASATGANARRRRVDFRTGFVLAAGTIPGAWAGRELVGRLEVPQFCACFAALLVLVAAYLAFVRLREGKGLARGTPREIVDSEGQAHRYEANSALGFLASLGVGVIASLFGVGGGLLLVPFMVIVYGTPILVATATSQFTFLFTASAGLLESLRRGHLTGAGLQVILLLGAGAVLGAPLGVAAAKRVRPGLVRAILSAVLVTVAAILLLGALAGPGPRRVQGP
jgi:uncharacterized membrane protein YfcA